MQNFLEEQYDAIVVGAGHAGCEAALALARNGYKTIIFTVSIDSIAMMACNPNIGGTSKGHIVREIDALGGEMAKNIDKTFIQSKMLNKSKGPAVHSLRAQADKKAYSNEMRQVIENTENLIMKQAEVKELIVETNNEKKFIKGIITTSGAKYISNIVILATGVYLNARCLFGDVIENTGPSGLRSANYLTKSLLDHGIDILRFKTGTPARVDKRSIDFNKLTEQKGDVPIIPFSFFTEKKSIQKDQISCFLAYTNEKTHEIIKQNINRSPLFSGEIKGVGPRYCPSIEDKVVRFKDKERHQIFIEPEGLYTNEMYLSGMSSSLPDDVQVKMIRTMDGFENAVILRNAYAIEYDCIDANQLKLSLEFKNIDGLFACGQINGSSGYEEAAGQGLIAGINAVRKLKNLDPLILKRSDAYIGVLIDDLVCKKNIEPYRMMTSRAEYRLLLRQDNADRRLIKFGYENGLIEYEKYKRVLDKEIFIENELNRLKKTFVGSNENINNFLNKNNSSPINSGVTLSDLCKRPELSYELIEEIDINRPKNYSDDFYEQVSIEIKYEGYIEREKQQVEYFKKMEEKKLPQDIDYMNIKNLRIEARQKLDMYKPENIGMASRISGVSPSDIAVLLVYLKK